MGNHYSFIMLQNIIHFITTVFGFIAYPFLFIILITRMLFDKENKDYYLARLGLSKVEENYSGQTVWIHIKNEFEVTALKNVVETILERKYNIYVSSMRMKGYKRALRAYGGRVHLIYMPILNNIKTAAIVDKISPEYVISSNLLVSPNFVYSLHRKSIPLYLLNAYVNRKYISTFYTLGFFLKPYWNMYKNVFAQTENDLYSLIRIGIDKEKISITGNTRYDISVNIIDEKYEATDNLIPKDKLIITVSKTHAEEERPILEAIKNAGLGDDVYLILSPYEITRAGELYHLAKEYGYDTSLYSNRLETGKNAMVINVLHEVLYWYKKCDMAIMGGSFLKDIGGHDILEPICFAKPIVVGPYMHNFQKMYEYLKNTIVTCARYEQITQVIKDFHSNRTYMNTIAGEALVLVKDNKGASNNIITAIDRYQGKLTK